MRTMMRFTFDTDEGAIIKTKLSIKAISMNFTLNLRLYLGNPLLEKFPLIVRDKDTERVNNLRAVHAKSYASTVNADQLAFLFSTSLAVLELLSSLAPT